MGGTATSSSQYQKDQQPKEYAPHRAIDGKIDCGNKFFHSVEEDNPWLQWHLPFTIRVESVSIATRAQPKTLLLHEVAVRAGVTMLDTSFKGVIEINTLCGNYIGPGQPNEIYVIQCNSPIVAAFVTVQTVVDQSTLEINELWINRGKLLLH